MPIYEYLCASCQHRVEVKQKVNDPPLSTCDRCGQAVTKIISAPAIMFKGSGWYVTDYSDKLKAPKDSESPAPSGNGRTDTSKASTPAANGAPPTPAPAPKPSTDTSSSESKSSAPSSSSGSSGS